MVTDFCMDQTPYESNLLIELFWLWNLKTNDLRFVFFLFCLIFHRCFFYGFLLFSLQAEEKKKWRWLSALGSGRYNQHFWPSTLVPFGNWTYSILGTKIKGFPCRRMKNPNETLPFPHFRCPVECRSRLLELSGALRHSSCQSVFSCGGNDFRLRGKSGRPV